MNNIIYIYVRQFSFFCSFFFFGSERKSIASAISCARRNAIFAYMSMCVYKYYGSSTGNILSCTTVV